jgi:predicted RNA-binding protein (virulence factor B family)
MLKLGLVNALEVLRETSVGLFLGDENHEVLLPNKYVPEDVQVGDTLEVFIYTDSEDRPVATTLKPKIQLGEFACLEVKQVTDFGAFLDWGLAKDLLVPSKEQMEKMKPREFHVVYMYLDEKTNRLAASSRLKNYLKTGVEVKEGDEVNLMVCRHSELGIQVLINDSHLGLLYHDQVFKRLKVGDRLPGYIKLIREDGKIDVSLQKIGYAQVVDSQQTILDYLKKNKGTLNLTDKSDPKEISNKLGMSKSTFKKAIGGLYKIQKIRIEETKIVLICTGS